MLIAVFIEFTYPLGNLIFYLFAYVSAVIRVIGLVTIAVRTSSIYLSDIDVFQICTLGLVVWLIRHRADARIRLPEVQGPEYIRAVQLESAETVQQSLALEQVIPTEIGIEETDAGPAPSRVVLDEKIPLKELQQVQNP